MGFFLMGSVVYLVTLLPPDWVLPFLLNIFAVAFASWLWGQIGHLGASRLRRCISKTCAVGILCIALWWSYLSLQETSFWEPFEVNRFEELLGKEQLLVEFTADWCPSCKAMEHTTLNDKRIAKLYDKYGMRTIRVDMTRENDTAKAFRTALGSESLPVLALFPRGEKAHQPLVLRDIVTPQQLKEAMDATFSKR